MELSLGRTGRCTFGSPFYSLSGPSDGRERAGVMSFDFSERDEPLTLSRSMLLRGEGTSVNDIIPFFNNFTCQFAGHVIRFAPSAPLRCSGGWPAKIVSTVGGARGIHGRCSWIRGCGCFQSFALVLLRWRGVRA